jgi:hypothetical protein
MTARWLSRIGLLTILLGAAAMTGCVERRYLIITDPPSATVLENGRPVAPAPAHHPFDYYGLYRFQLQHDGCQTLTVDQDVTAPWWAYPPFDFITENILPWTIRDIREYHYQLPQMPVVPDQESIGKGTQLRERAATLGDGQPPRPEVAPQPQKLQGSP